jgi:hypothetical protein
MNLFVPEPVEKKSLTPTSFLRPSASPSSRKFPAKLASAQRSRAANSDEITDGLVAVEKSYPRVIRAASPAVLTDVVAPVTAVAGVSVRFDSSINPINAAKESVVVVARKLRDPPPVDLWAPIVVPDRFDQPCVEQEDHISPHADDFWKKHQLWGNQDKEFFDDIYHTTEKPFGDGGSIQQWIQMSCQSSTSDCKYLDYQPVARRGLSAAQRDALNKELQRVSSNNVDKFYWLLLRLVYSSSKLQHPEKSWWYSKDGDCKDGAPNNLCSVLREIQREGIDVFSRYSKFNDIIHYHVEGLKSAHEKKTLKDSAITEFIHWVRSRPLLGVRDARHKFERLLQFLENPLAILNDCAMSETKKVQLGEPANSASFQRARVSPHGMSSDITITFTRIFYMFSLSCCTSLTYRRWAMKPSICNTRFRFA